MNFNSIFSPEGSDGLNACIGGDNIHDFYSYAEGYFNAANHLCDKVISERLTGDLDIVILPILYSVRHGIELALKAHLLNLRECNIEISDNDAYGHDINTLWSYLKDKTPRDPRFTDIISSIDHIISEMAKLDPTAQEFRYPTRTDNNQTIPNRKLINYLALQLIITELTSKLKCFLNESECYIAEYRTETRTKELNREQLSELSILLPNHETWKDESSDFSIKKSEFIEKYHLSSNAFSRAIKLIERHREFAGNIGIESDISIFDSDIIAAMMNNHNSRKCEVNDKPTSGIVKISDIVVSNEFPEHDFFQTIKDRISIDDIIKMETICYMALKGEYSEFFNDRLQTNLEKINNASDEEKEKIKYDTFIHQYSKTTFLNDFKSGLRLIGRPTLAAIIN
ncbi:hypothetical protein AH421_22090 [Salmonella enterica]|nr:hypothetical protein [Salmonella enterica]